MFCRNNNYTCLLHSQRNKSTDDILKHSSDLFQTTGLDIACKPSPNPKETVCMKCQTLFIKKKKKKKNTHTIKLLSVEFALNVVKVKSETIS